MFWLRPVMVPFVLAVLLTYVLRPPMDWMTNKLKAPPWLATTIRVGSVAIVVGIGLYYGLGTIEAGDADADPMLMYQ